MSSKKNTYRLTNKSLADLANPHRQKDYYARLAEAGALDLRDNHEVIELPNGRIKVVPIDESKKFSESQDSTG